MSPLKLWLSLSIHFLVILKDLLFNLFVIVVFCISVAYKGQFYLRLNAEELESLLTKES